MKWEENKNFLWKNDEGTTFPIQLGPLDIENEQEFPNLSSRNLQLPESTYVKDIDKWRKNKCSWMKASGGLEKRKLR